MCGCPPLLPPGMYFPCHLFLSSCVYILLHMLILYSPKSWLLTISKCAYITSCRPKNVSVEKIMSGNFYETKLYFFFRKSWFRWIAFKKQFSKQALARRLYKMETGGELKQWKNGLFLKGDIISILGQAILHCLGMSYTLQVVYSPWALHTKNVILLPTPMENNNKNTKNSRFLEGFITPSWELMIEKFCTQISLQVY